MSGSCRSTHMIFGAVKPGSGGTPASWPILGIRSLSSLHSSCDRLSFQRMQGLSTSIFRSSSTAPCICPDKPMQVILAPANSGIDSRPRIASCSADSHCDGSCSLHPGLGDSVGSEAEQDATILRCMQATTLTADVPRSTPRINFRPFFRLAGFLSASNRCQEKQQQLCSNVPGPACWGNSLGDSAKSVRQHHTICACDHVVATESCEARLQPCCRYGHSGKILRLRIAQNFRSIIIFLISAIAFAGFSPLGQVCAQLRMV